MGKRGIGRGFRGGRPDKKRLFLLAAAALAVLWLLVSGIRWLVGEMAYWGREPGEIVTAALEQLAAADSYTYVLETALREGDQETPLAVFSGVKNGEDAWVKGQLAFLDTTVEMVRKDGQLYRREAAEGRWVRLPFFTLEILDQLMVEMVPTAIFSFSDFTEARFAGREKRDGVRCRVYEVMTKGEHPWLVDYWENFNFRFWIDQSGGQLVQGEVQADQPGNGARGIMVRLALGDFNVPVKIQGPDLAETN